MDTEEFFVNDVVSFKDGTSGKIIGISQPLDTYKIYHVKSMFDGTVKKFAKHQLIKVELSQEQQHVSGSTDEISNDQFDFENDHYSMQLLLDENEFTQNELSIEPNKSTPTPAPIYYRHMEAIPSQQR